MNHGLKRGAEPVHGYTLIEPLGRGGFGEVWKATGPGGFQVALKFVALEGKVGTVELRALEVIKSIRHPHLLANFGSWQRDGLLIIAMELADKTLSDRLNECLDQGLPGIPAPEIFEYFLEAAKGLDFLNEPRHPSGEGGTQGIQHRDIKPQNLLLVGGSVKVADFGLARMLEHSMTNHTGSVTTSYAPPEFFQEKTTSRSDQYSLAVTYCQLRGGRLPFEGNPAAVIAGHLYGEPDLSMLPAAERGAVARALSKPSRGRWPSCRAFVQAVMAAERVEAPPTVVSVGSSRRQRTLPDEPSFGPPIKLDPVSELAPAAHRTSKRSSHEFGAWALVAATLLIAVILLFPRGKPEVPLGSRPPGNGSPDAESKSTAEQPGSGANRPAPEVTTERPGQEVTKAATRPEKDKEAVRALIERGLSFIAIEDGEKAFAEFDQAVRLDPGNAEAHAGRALHRGIRGDREQRLAEAEEALRLDPRSALAHAARGLALFSNTPTDNNSRALDEFDEAIRLDPKLAIGHALRANVFIVRHRDSQKVGELVLAMEACDRAIQLDRKMVRAYVIRGDARSQIGDLDRAMADLDTVLLLKPKNAFAMALRGVVWNARGDHSRAIAECNRAIEVDPSHPTAYSVRSAAFAKVGDQARADADAEEASRRKRERQP
jgi:serine/threonine protein kinase